MINTPAATSSNTDKAHAIYVVICRPLSLSKAKAAYNDNKNMFITAHQMVHKSVRFHSST